LVVGSVPIIWRPVLVLAYVGGMSGLTQTLVFGIDA
jgi:hypothetical protein